MSDAESLFDSDDESRKRPVTEDGQGMPLHPNITFTLFLSFEYIHWYLDEHMPRKKQKNIMIDDEAERGSDDEGSDDELSDEEKNEYIMDGFVVPEEEGSDEDREDKEDRPIRKRTYERLKRGGVQLVDQEDLDLIAENNRLRQESTGEPLEVLF